MALEDFIKTLIHRDGRYGGESLIVATHAAQLSMWIVRQGLRFYPFQDDQTNSRLKKIEDVIRFNKLDLYYKGIVNLFLCSGSILWYLRPTGSENYEIHWYRGGKPDDPEAEYKAYYKPGGRELDQVIIRYYYEDYSPNISNSFYGIGAAGNQKWVRLKITATEIIEEKFNTIPSLLPDWYQSSVPNASAPFDRKVIQNSLGFIPCVASPNFPLKPGDPGNGEFDWIRTPIEAEDLMRQAMLDNIFLFSNPTLVTTRPKNQVVDSINEMEASRASWSSQQGYGSFAHPSTRKEDPWVRGSRFGGGDPATRKNRIARIIGNVTPDERFGYIFPDPINGDQWRYSQEYRTNIHEALGGIDPLHSPAGMTFGEVKSLYGKVAATSLDKCKSLWTFGLAKILEMMIAIEEKMWLDSYKYFLVTESRQKEEWQKMVQKQGFIPDQLVFQDFQNKQQMQTPPGVTGLIPNGDRKVEWNWTGPVFEEMPRDKLDLSIMVRNLQELGVGSLDAMQFLFPDKEPREIKKMLKGVPFRFISSVTSSIGALLQLQQSMMQLPDPQNPKVPLGLRITPLITTAITSLSQEISYGSEFYPSPDGDGFNSSDTGVSSNNANDGTTLAPALSTNLSTSPGAVPTPGNSLSAPSNGLPNSNSGYAAGLFPGSSAGYPGTSPYPSPEWQNPIPTPGGSTLSGNSSLSASDAASDVPSGYAPGIPYDISTLPSLYNQLFPPVQPPTNSGTTGRPKSKRPKG